MHRSVLEVSFLEIKWNICLWPKQQGLPKQRDVASRHAVRPAARISQQGGHIFEIKFWMYAITGGPNMKLEGTDFIWGGRTPLAAPLATVIYPLHHLQYISWFDVSGNRRKSMNHWRHKTLQNLRSIAPKQDEALAFRVLEVWSSSVQGTLSNLLPKVLKGKRWIHFGFCCIAHFNVATLWKKFVRKGCGCVHEYSDQVRLWETTMAYYAVNRNPVVILWKVG